MLASYNTESGGWMSEEERRVVMHGSSEEVYNLGIQFRKGDGVQRNARKAAQCYKEAARQGCVAAQFNLGAMCYQGEGLIKNPMRAAEWFAQAASHGHSGAQYNLAKMCVKGEGIQKDVNRAIELYQLSASQGDDDAQTNLGYMYEKGIGVPKDVCRALECYEQAAAQGNAIAQRNLARLHYEGEGTPKNLATAATFLQQATDNGNHAAMCYLGIMHCAGEGTAMDRPKGIELIKEAAANGVEAAEEFLAGLVQTEEGAREENLKHEKMTCLKNKALKKERAHAAAPGLIQTLLYEDDADTLQQAVHQATSLQGHVQALDVEAIVAQERLAQLQLYAQAARKAAVIEEHLEHYEDMQLVAATEVKEIPGGMKKVAPDADGRDCQRCVICLDQQNTHIVAPCGHQCLCEGCTGKVTRGSMLCPVCRQEILLVFRVFK